MSAATDRIYAAVKAAPRSTLGFVLASVAGYGSGPSLSDLLTDLAPFIEAEITKPPPDVFAALHAAEEAVLVAGGWRRAESDEHGDDWWEHDTKGRESHDCALAMEQYDHEHRIGGAS